MSFRVSGRAERDLRAIYANGVRDFGSAHADCYFDELFDRFEFLAANPEAARLRHEVSPPVRAYRYKAHLIVYAVLPNGTVEIVRIPHGREDWQADPHGDRD